MLTIFLTMCYFSYIIECIFLKIEFFVANGPTKDVANGAYNFPIKTTSNIKIWQFSSLESESKEKVKYIPIEGWIFFSMISL